MENRKIVLASASPRRKELLQRFFDDFEIITDSSEEIVIAEELPWETVQRLAKQKAKNIADGLKEDAVVIGADTMVALGDVALGKPDDEEDAYKMLKSLSGKSHTVYTAVAVIDTKSGKDVVEYVATEVKFKELTDKEIYSYIESKEPMDKAGAYGIQELGALLVEGINGDYFNVVGLPLCRLGKIFKEFGINLLG